MGPIRACAIPKAVPWFWCQVAGVYRPRFKLDHSVLRVPIVPGSDPRTMLGDCAARGVQGIVLEARSWSAFLIAP